MITIGFIITSVLIGYFIAGLFNYMRISNSPDIDKPGLLLKPSGKNTIGFIFAWPVSVYFEAYFANITNKGKAIVYGTLSPIVMLVGFSLIGAVTLYPHYVINNQLLAILASAGLFLIGATILAPLIGLLCGIVVYLIAQPILLFLPNKNENIR